MPASEFDSSSRNEYEDAENYIRYVFSGFDEKLTLSKKLELIKKLGVPRKHPLKGKIEIGNVKAELPNPIWEFQMIHKMPEDQQ
jgi:hypothetical protein